MDFYGVIGAKWPFWRSEGSIWDSKTTIWRQNRLVATKTNPNHPKIPWNTPCKHSKHHLRKSIFDGFYMGQRLFLDFPLLFILKIDFCFAKRIARFQDQSRPWNIFKDEPKRTTDGWEPSTWSWARHHGGTTPQNILSPNLSESSRGCNLKTTRDTNLSSQDVFYAKCHGESFPRVKFRIWARENRFSDPHNPAKTGKWQKNRDSVP